MWRAANTARRGFTLVEALVVILIIGVLMGIAFPAMRMVRRETQNTQCMSNLRQNYGAIEAYMQINRETLPMCDFIPVVTDNGPQGGLPNLLKAYLPPTSESWLCPSDENEESLSTGTSYLYVPGLLRFTPAVQAEVTSLLMGFAPGSVTPELLETTRLDAEGRLMTSFFRANPGSFPLLVDSEDRHERSGSPRNGVYFDGSVRAANAPPEEESEPVGGGGGGSP